MEAIDVLGQIPPVSRGALRHEVMQRLLRAIFEGRLPAGTRLMVLKLAGRFGISSTPVREALGELDAVGVVEFVHNRGAVVAPFGPKELRDLYQIRRILESEATRSAVGGLALADLWQLREETVALLGENEVPDWLPRTVSADRRLHKLIATNCGNSRLTREIRRYDLLVQVIREIIGADRAAQHRAMDEHLALLEALLAQDAEGAARAMARHIDGAADSAESVLFARRR
jgi:DNA-binding GntR family transcriptional regulator